MPTYLLARWVRSMPMLCGLVFGAGCWCGSPHVADAPKTPPDQQFRTGSAHGYDMFVWTCVGGEHVVISEAGGEMVCESAKVERVPCGTKTPVELEVEREHQRQRAIDRW